jgi:dTDP-4-dehydrorhamnose reductase
MPHDVLEYARLCEGYPELWGGIECTVARIGESYRDQSAETGHDQRLSDLDAIAALGIRTLRYPALIEKIAAGSPDKSDWRWHDGRLGRLRDLGISPILGLVHHGSGPRYTTLLDPAFPDIVARHAHNVAARYPWVEMFTPVNEPLTTARFSGLYGHWYPHRRNYRTFLKALVMQCRAVLQSMAAIRSVTPSAKLVQTEDLGRTFSTPLLAYQAEHENERRWLSFDLLCGLVDRSHPWFEIFRSNGITEAELRPFLDAPCPPDIVGINHYLTSDRYLDQKTSSYPAGTVGGNGRHRYADVAAARVDLPAHELGPFARLMEVWQRYRLPTAITEVHNGSTRDEQLRWLMHVWSAACRARHQGVDLRAVTVWCLFGSVDWDSLLTERRGMYEPGAFDVRSSPIRPTAVAAATRSLALSGSFDHPVLEHPGWWTRSDRFHRPSAPAVSHRPAKTCPVVIADGGGTLAAAFARHCDARGIPHLLLGRADTDLAMVDTVQEALKSHEPWAVIDTVDFTALDPAVVEPPPGRGERRGSDVLARACAEQGTKLVTFSSDLVFDGCLGRPYVEGDAPRPACAVGERLSREEVAVRLAHPAALVIRTSALFAPWDVRHFLQETLAALAAGKAVRAVDSHRVSPTYVPDLVNATLDLLIDGESGLWHLANEGTLSWYEFARLAAEHAGVSTERLSPSRTDPARVTALSSERGCIMPKIECAIRRFTHETTGKGVRDFALLDVG